MHIDKFKDEDGYYDEDKCFYESAESFLHVSILRFCGCGDPEENLQFIRDGLAHIDKDQPDNLPLDQWTKQRTEEGIKIFGNEISRQFFYYWCDVEKLTDHGYCIPGWLTDKGKELLEDISELYS